MCFICGKQLSNHYNLRVHMETHQNMQYACSACSHVSRSRDALRKHVSYRHPPTGALLDGNPSQKKQQHQQQQPSQQQQPQQHMQPWPGNADPLLSFEEAKCLSLFSFPHSPNLNIFFSFFRFCYCLFSFRIYQQRELRSFYLLFYFSLSWCFI